MWPVFFSPQSILSRGFLMALIRKYTATATVRPIEDESEYCSVLASCVDAIELDPTVHEQLAMIREAAPSPVVNGKPRMLHVSAWIAHEGPNDNNDAFVKEELDLVVANGLFGDAWAGIIDFNHDHSPIGYWYSAQFLFDEVAQKWGILAHGAVWAWLFPEVADEMLLIQQRDQTIKVSMMALTNRLELISSGDTVIAVIHDPIFVGASLLNVTPGDPSADGLVFEDPTDADREQRRQQLMERAAQFKEDNKMEETLSQILAALPQVSEEIRDAIVAQADQIRSEVAQHEARVAELTDALSASEDRVAELETIVEERNVAIESARTENEALATLVTELEGRVAEFVEAAMAAERLARAESRFNELPEAVRTRIASRPAETQTRLRERWADMSDDEWADTKEELSIGAEVTQDRLPNLFGSSPKGGSNGRINLDQHIIN
jgi:hypothetical protein